MSEGSASGYAEFFDQELIPDALKLLLDAWEMIPPAQPTELEDKITERIAAKMKREKKSRKLAFSIHFQVTPLDDAGAVAARIDFKLLSSFDEDSYLAFECKRLRIPQPSGLDYNTDDYVGEEGMGRFACGKYAPTQHHGVMVAYVMDGKVENAKKSVLKRIQHERGILGLCGQDWLTSTFLPNEPHVHETRHMFVSRSSRDFAFQHIFFGVGRGKA